MNEKPILFSAPMVRALLDGRKTQTRRIAKLPRGFVWINEDKGIIAPKAEEWPHYDLEESTSPYGRPGDCLWVREGIQASDDFGSPIQYVADGEIDFDSSWCWQRLRLPSIHCPRGISRITLEITGVKVERLQDISEEDAIAEGIHVIHHGLEGTYYHHSRTEPHPRNWIDPTDAFRELWVSINGPESWAANPWVWAISFKRVTP